MTPEQLLLSAITTVVTALVYLFKLLWAESEQCKKDRVALREDVESLQKSVGMAQGVLVSFERCPAPACPFKGNEPVKQLN